ncbi:MAG TPA: response regulator [Chloroflexota bacterium]|nr:response regulator [Chloroflexota bacterium]
MAKILVVDDDPDVNYLMGAWLEHAGHEVKTLTDDLSAYRQAQSYEPDLLLLDIHMPYMTGWSEMRLFQVDPNLRQVPVVLVSADSLALDSQVPRTYPIFGRLLKPFTRDQLLDTVSSALA